MVVAILHKGYIRPSFHFHSFDIGFEGSSMKSMVILTLACGSAFRALHRAALFSIWNSRYWHIVRGAACIRQGTNTAHGDAIELFIQNEQYSYCRRTSEHGQKTKRMYTQCVCTELTHRASI